MRLDQEGEDAWFDRARTISIILDLGTMTIHPLGIMSMWIVTPRLLGCDPKNLKRSEIVHIDPCENVESDAPDLCLSAPAIDPYV
jgi:hypothetical protein